jgi:hypothetical protein
MSKVKIGCKNPDKAHRKRKVLVPTKPRPKSMRVPLKKVSPKQAKRLAELNKLKLKNIRLKHPLTTPLRPVSPKQAKRLNKMYKLTDYLKELSHNTSELSGKGIDQMNDIEPHHIQGRIGMLLFNPFNIILLRSDEHRIEQAHMSYERKQELLAIVKVIRLKQGFIESDYV